MSTVENFHHSKWVLATNAELKKLLIWPNRVLHAVDGKQIVILVQRSSANGFAFSVNNIQSFGAEAEKVRVLLTKSDGKVVAETSLAKIIEEVKGETPIKSKYPGWGDYFWLNDDFTMSRQGAGIGSAVIDYLTERM